MRWMHRVRLYPSATQEARLRFMLDITRQTYNALLDERRYAWTARRIRVTSKQQYAEMTALRKEDVRFASVYRECQDAVLHRLDLAMQAFFRRVKRGETPGYPRFKPAARWKQLEFPHGDRALKLDEAQKRVRIPGVGTVRLRKGRAVPAFGRTSSSRRTAAGGPCSSVTASRTRYRRPARSSGSIAAFTFSRRRAKANCSATAASPIGIVALWVVMRGRSLQRAKKMRAVAARTAATLSRIAAVQRLARAKEREANARLDALHTAAHRLVLSADVIGLEALNVRGMTRSAKGSIEKPGEGARAKSGLNRAMLDAGFGIFRRLIGEKQRMLFAGSSTSRHVIRHRRAGVVCTLRRRVVGEGAFAALRVAGNAMRTLRRHWRSGDEQSCCSRASYRGREPRSRRWMRREDTHNYKS